MKRSDWFWSRPDPKGQWARERSYTLRSHLIQVDGARALCGMRVLVGSTYDDEALRCASCVKQGRLNQWM